MINIYLDDLREIPKGFIEIRNYNDFVQWIQENGLPNFISFDHDLGLNESGYDCAKFLVNYCLDNNLQLPQFIVHSQNPVGKENIKKLLLNFNKHQK